jgi:transposase
MTLSPEQHARIRRLYFGEHWKVGTIVSELGVHADAVQRAIETPRFGNRVDAARPSMLDPFKPFILATLDQHPRLCSSRLLQMLQGRGYKGGIATLRRYVTTVRPASVSEGYLALETLPGEQGQVDWASCGKLRIGAALRPLLLFVMVLSFSRRIFARFFLDAQMDNFRRGHVEAFEHFGGVPRELLYDNLKSVVLDRVGEHVRFHPQVLELASHYCYAPKPCAVYRGNEKGKVERAIQYIRTSFLEARTYRDLADLNGQLQRWNAQVADARVHPTDSDKRSIRECFEQEQPCLLPLPAHSFECDRVLPKKSGKRPYLRFDGNDYSIPHGLVHKPVTLVASDTRVRVLDGSEVVADHARCFDRRQRIEDPAHLRGLIEHKRAARQLTGRDRILRVSKHADGFYAQLAQRGANIGAVTSRLLRLLDTYGAETLDQALGEALSRDAIGASAVAHLCDQLRRKQGRLAPLPPEPALAPHIANLRVVSHDLSSYDDLGADGDDDQDGGDDDC